MVKPNLTSLKFQSLILIVTLTMASLCLGQDSRSGKKEISASYHGLGGATLASGGVTAKEDDWSMYGVNFGMNPNEHLNLNFDIMYGNIKVTASGSGITGTGEQNTIIYLLNLDYNILSKPITPVITGGLGYGYSFGDVTVTSGGTSLSVSAYGTSFVYSLGAGGRWDINDNLFLKALYRTIHDSDDSRDGFAVYLGCMFD